MRRNRTIATPTARDAERARHRERRARAERDRSARINGAQAQMLSGYVRDAVPMGTLTDGVLF